MGGLVTESGVSAATGEPFVVVKWEGPERSGQFTVEEARQFGLVMLSAAEAAVSDATLVAWLRRTMDLPLEKAGAVLADYRVHRAKFEEDQG